MAPSFRTTHLIERGTETDSDGRTEQTGGQKQTETGGDKTGEDKEEEGDDRDNTIKNSKI